MNRQQNAHFRQENAHLRLLQGFLITLIFASISFGLPTQQATRLTWEAPTTNVDGSPLTDGSGYYVYWREAGGTYTDVNRYQVSNFETVTVQFTDITGLPSGALTFAVTAYDSSGNESDYSDEATRVPLVIPGAPGNLQVR